MARMMMQSWSGLVLRGVLIAGMLLSGLPLRAAEPYRPPQEPNFADRIRASLAPVESDEPETVRLTFFNATWPKILEKIAEETGSTLVMHNTPPGRFTRLDSRDYTRTEAVQVMNQELEPKGYRVLERDRFLIVLHVDELRAQYGRPRMLHASNRPAARQYPVEPPPPAPKYRRSVSDISRAQHTGRNAEPPARRPALHQASGEENPPGAQPPAGPAADEPREPAVVRLKHQRAADVARRIYEMFKKDAVLIDRGPAGLPAFSVSSRLQA
ncbi:MAG: hypothetical protein ACREIV_02000, partial [Planctomycetaceae bacterium]